GGQQKNFALAMEKVHQRLGDAPNRSASFMCVLALAWPDGHAEIFEGKVDGNIAWPPRGDKGFGYDPIFVPEGYTETFAEMDAKKKQEMSHRALAFAKMVNECFAQ
ncbi:MAG: non-canonical purine NTP pyrophosphatase, partial [Alphaproteobacteria bacterium]